MGSGEALTQLRKESQDIYNRIHSIAEDAEFVKQVHQHYHDLPLLRKWWIPLCVYRLLTD